MGTELWSQVPSKNTNVWLLQLTGLYTKGSSDMNEGAASKGSD